MATTSRRKAAPAAPEADLRPTETATAAAAPRKPRSRKPAQVSAPATDEASVPVAEAVAAAPTPTDAPVEAPPPAPRKPRSRKPAVAQAPVERSTVPPTELAAEPVTEPAAAPATEPVAAETTDAPAAPAEPRPARKRAAKKAPVAATPAAELAAPAPAPRVDAAEAPPETTPGDAEPAPTADADTATEAVPAAADLAAPAPSMAPPIDPPLDPHPARITLRAGLRRQPVWQPAHPASARADELAARWQTGADDALALTDADALAQLLAQLERAGEPVEVDPAVWTLLALRGDLHRRIDHLSALYPQGLEGVQLPEAEGLAPARACQLEAAFFAACVGACLIADEAPLQPLREALLAWQLVQRHFGATRLAIVTARPGDWQALLPAGAAAAITWCAPGDPLAELALDALIIDQRDVLGAGVPALPETPWCWVIAPVELLARRDRATAWLAAVDRVGAGALADWVDGAGDEVLAPLLLRRRFAEVADQWPLWAPAERAVEHTPDELATHETLHQAMRPVLARWQRSGFLSDTDQLALQRSLRAREHLARAAAIGALAPLLHKALVGGAQRAVVFSADAGFLGPLAELLQAEDLPSRVLPLGPEADTVLRAWRDADGAQVLLVADEPQGPRIPTQPHRPVVVALDAAGDEGLRQARLARVRTAHAQREVPVWQLRPAGVPLLPAAPAHGLLRGEALDAWLQALGQALLPAPEAAPVAV